MNESKSIEEENMIYFVYRKKSSIGRAQNIIQRMSLIKSEKVSETMIIVGKNSS